MKVRGLQFKVLLLVATVMTVAIGVGVASLSRVYATIQDLDRIQREDFETQSALLRASVAFKQQVQEWKNVLLRGKDGAALEKHWKAFEEDERNVAIEIKGRALGHAPRRPARGARQGARGHKAAGEGYRAGPRHVQASGADPFAGDKAVTGIDRPLTATLADAQKAAGEFGTRATALAVKRAEQSYFLALGGMVGAMIVTLVALWFYFRRSVLAPMQTAVGFAGASPAGDLTSRVQATSDDEAGSCCVRWRKCSRRLASGAQVRSRRRGGHGVEPGRRGNDGHLAAHRGAGLEPRGDGGEHGGAREHRDAERRERAPRRRAGARRLERAPNRAAARSCTWSPPWATSTTARNASATSSR
jgi:hypothetical protein